MSYFPPSSPLELLTALWNLWQSLMADGAERLREECGLDLKEFIAASYLQAAPAHPAELAERMQMPRYEVSRLLRSLEDKGLARRTRDGVDRRQVVVELTPGGLEAWQRGLRTAEQVTAPYLAGLSEGQRQDLLLTLTRLTRPRQGELHDPA